MSTCQGALAAPLRLNPAHWALTVVGESDIHGGLLWLQALSSTGYAGWSRDLRQSTHTGCGGRPEQPRQAQEPGGLACVNTSGETPQRAKKARPRWGLPPHMNRGPPPSPAAALVVLPGNLPQEPSGGLSGVCCPPPRTAGGCWWLGSGTTSVAPHNTLYHAKRLKW